MDNQETIKQEESLKKMINNERKNLEKKVLQK